MLLPLPEFIQGHRTALADAIEGMPSSRMLGLSVLGFGEGVSAIEMAVRDELTFDGLTVQGGMVGTLADYAAVSAATAAAPIGSSAATTGFTVHNLAPARGERLVGIGRVVKLGRSQATAAADVYAVDGGAATLVATGLATCRVIEPGR